MIFNKNFTDKRIEIETLIFFFKDNDFSIKKLSKVFVKFEIKTRKMLN